MWIGFFGILVIGILGGSTPILVKLGLTEFPPLLLTTLRFIIATIIFLPFFLQEKRHLTRHDIWILFTRSLFFAGNAGIFSIAIQYTTAIISQVLYSFVPGIVLVMSFLFLRENMTKQRIIGLFIAVIGVGILIQQSIIKTEVLTFGTLIGNMLTLLAALSWSAYTVVSKRLTDVYSPVVTTFASFVTIIIILVPLLPIEYILQPVQLENVDLSGVGSVMYLGIFSSAFMFFLTQLLIQKTSSFVTSLSQYLAPFAGAMIAIPILGEKLTPLFFLAGVCVVVGVFYATSYEGVRKHIKSVLQ
ncbi:MAG: DMT family transporter [Candidatus Levyibacteriota bacterium]|nr:MAG: DMT family transporter [Candidatus Levybacteria bacterium]